MPYRLGLSELESVASTKYLLILLVSRPAAVRVLEECGLTSTLEFRSRSLSIGFLCARGLRTYHQHMTWYVTTRTNASYRAERIQNKKMSKSGNTAFVNSYQVSLAAMVSIFWYASAIPPMALLWPLDPHLLADPSGPAQCVPSLTASSSHPSSRLRGRGSCTSFELRYA